jgi:Uma2 family endonuclease
MSAVTFAETVPAAGVPFTVADLERTSDDGRRYELLDGTLVVSPLPAIGNQRVGFRLAYALEAACPDGLVVVPEPAVQVSSQTELAPDIVVAREDQAQGMKFTEPPLLVVEVRSPRTALIDLNRKKSTYEKFGVPSYWIVDPDPERPELTVFELCDGHYALEAKTTQTVTLERPFSVTIALASLTAGLRASPPPLP